MFLRVVQDLVSRVPDSEKVVLATIALKGKVFIRQIRKRDDVRLIVLVESRRQTLVEEIVGEVRNLIEGG